MFARLLKGRAPGAAEEVKEVKMGKVTLGFFPTALTEEQLHEAREKSIRRIFGTTEPLKYIKDPNKVGDFDGILRNRTEEHCQEGNKYFTQAEWEKAAICYTKALNLDPHMVDLYEKLAEAFLQLCDFQSAANYLRKAYLVSAKKREIGLRLSFILHVQGQCLYEQGFYLDALQSFTRALELQPRSAVYRMRSIACLAALKRYNDCLQMVNEEVARKRKSPDLLVLRARLYEYFGRVTFTFYNLQNALELDPDHTEAKVMLDNLKREGQRWKDQAVIKAAKGNLKGGLLKINKAIDYNPLEASYFLFRGTMLRRLKDFNSAIEDCLKAVELSRGQEGSEIHPEAQKQVLLTYNDFAVHCYAKGFFEEAVVLLNKAIKGEQKEMGLYMNRGDCFLKLGELNFAMADYQQALELSPLDPGLHKHIAWLYHEMGLQEFQERRFIQAKSYFSLAIDNNPNEFKYFLHRAKCHMFLQEIMSAKEDTVMALLLQPTKDEVHLLASTVFPGEPIQAILKSKVGQYAKALLDQKQAAFSKYKVMPKISPGVPGSSSSKDMYIQNEHLEKVEEEGEPEEKKTVVSRQQSKEHRLEEKLEQRLHARLAACQEKTHQVNKELKEVREKRVSLDPHSVRLDLSPQLPEKQSSKEPYQWRKFSQGIGHF